MSVDSAGSRRTRSRLPTLLIVIATVLAVLAGFAGYYGNRNVSPTYRSSGAVSFDQPDKLAASTSVGIIEKLSRIRALYAGLAKTDAVLNPVAQQVDLPRNIVASRVFTSADPASLLLIVGAQGSTQTSARRLAIALANQLVVTVNLLQDKANVPEKDRITASVVIEPRGATLASPTRRTSVTVGVVFALLVLLGVLGIGAFIRRPTG